MEFVELCVVEDAGVKSFHLKDDWGREINLTRFYPYEDCDFGCILFRRGAENFGYVGVGENEWTARVFILYGPERLCQYDLISVDMFEVGDRVIFWFHNYSEGNPLSFFETYADIEVQILKQRAVDPDNLQMKTFLKYLVDNIDARFGQRESKIEDEKDGN